MRSDRGGYASALEGVELVGKVNICRANGHELGLQLLELGLHLGHGVIWLTAHHGLFLF